MIQVAICDDIPEEIEKFKVHINRYANENQMQISVSGFSSADDIICALDNSAMYDVIFLDIYMDVLNGIDLAGRIAKQGKRSRIIFVSTSLEHALDAFGVNAIYYLVKPVEYDRFENAMSIALADKAKREEALTILSGNDVVKIPFDNIIYVEAQRNYQKIYLTSDRTEITKMSNSKFYEFVQARSEFVRLGASFILNMKYIQRISGKDIVLTNGKSLPVPRGSYAGLKEKYLEYFSGGNM